MMKIKSKVVSDRFEDEVVVVNLENGVYYSFRGSAPVIWESAEAGLSAESIVKRFTSLTPDQENKVLTFCGFLFTENLVTEDPSGSALSTSLPSVEFKDPEYLKFNDMADLIMIDPIHESDPQKGWPHKPV